MPTENIVYTCETSGTTQTCTIPLDNFYNGNVATFATPFFSAGDLFISLELLVLIIFGIIQFMARGVLSVKTHKKYTGVNQPEGKEEYKI
jgi:hypothetical protein